MLNISCKVYPEIDFNKHNDFEFDASCKKKLGRTNRINSAIYFFQKFELNIKNFLDLYVLKRLILGKF